MSTDPSQTTCGEEDDGVELDEDVTQSDSKRWKKCNSKVWKDFITIKGHNGKELAKCKHCNRNFVAPNNRGTSHLNNHFKNACLVIKQMESDSSKNATKSASDTTPKATTFKFDQERSRMDFANMVIKHNYHINMADNEFFEIFCNKLQSMFKLVSRNTVRSDVLNVYQIEKDKLYLLLEEICYKITLTTDIWTSDHQHYAYACLTVHYSTDDRDLKKKDYCI